MALHATSSRIFEAIQQSIPLVDPASGIPAEKYIPPLPYCMCGRYRAERPDYPSQAHIASGQLAHEGSFTTQGGQTLRFLHRSQVLNDGAGMWMGGNNKENRES